MARYRILQQPRFSNPLEPMYEVQERTKWFSSWRYRNVFNCLKDAESFVENCQKADAYQAVETKVIQEYD